ncbi:hypothetical protein [Exiguobacterium sp. AB2]|uniref:hypothetical protein n=1 Tax=Exiguobacterium sp. AB2 TaxID=1484479 RepID=UPI0004A9683A|nr:hypothetical protein [Exiguobacterium sp. AB2]KDN58951.1 hypothetical protein DI14_13845 [Exiguobacterium sp. AB2]
MSRSLLVGFSGLVTALAYFLLSPNLSFVYGWGWIGGTTGLLLLSVIGFSLHLGRKHHWTARHRFVVGIGLIAAFMLAFGLILWWIVAVNMNHI